MTTYETYLAAVERLRDDNYDCDWSRCYDKSIVYDAEHNPAPATVEWCRTLGGEMFGEALMWSMTKGDVVVLGIHGHDDQTVCSVGTKSIKRPTRRDVLSLLRVFSERKV